MSYDEQRISDQIDGCFHQQKIEWFEEALIVGTKIKIGKKYAEEYGFDEGEVYNASQSLTLCGAS